MAYESRFSCLDRMAELIERDRHEPAKIMSYAQQLHGIAHELRDVAEWADKPEGEADLRLSQARALLRSIAGGWLPNE